MTPVHTTAARTVLALGTGLAVAGCAVTGCGGMERNTAIPAESPAAPTVLAGNAAVVHVVDGDTVDIRIGSRRVRVRLIGVNTPETVDPRRPLECFGTNAKARTEALLPAGTPVRVERDVEPRDDYGRVLGYVYRAIDGAFINLVLVNEGFAVPLRIEPNSAHADEFGAAARDAEAAGRGLWSACPR